MNHPSAPEHWPVAPPVGARRAAPEQTRTAHAAWRRKYASGRRIDDDELRALGCFFPLHDYGDAVVLADPGVLIVPSFMGSAPLAAMHGYHPDDRFSKGCFLSDAPRSGPESLLGFKPYFERLVTELR